MPILFAVSPFAAMRSAPVRTQSTSPAAISRPAAESAITVNGMPVGLELPRSEARALEQRPRLADEHVGEQAALPRRPQRAERRPVAAGREGARVAVRERARPRLEQLGGVRGHPPAALDLVTVDSSRVLGGRFGAHPSSAQPEVDRRRAAVAQHAFGRDEILALRGSERVAVRGRDPDRRRAPDRERPDRLRHLGGGAALRSTSSSGQAPLVEEDDAVAPRAGSRVQARARSQHRRREAVRSPRASRS